MGYDSREAEAYRVAQYSLIDRSSGPVGILPLNSERLTQTGLLNRPVSLREGRMWDEISGAYMSTEFANSRFLTPILAQFGWALFVDSDVIFFGDIYELFDLADPQYAVMCVKHEPIGREGVKMDGQAQQAYSRKCWSSLMLFNCDHPSNSPLNLGRVNARPGRELHAFDWLEDAEIGALPGEWNWLVGLQPRPPSPKVAHFTLGGPWLPNWQRTPTDDLWLSVAADSGTRNRALEPRGSETAMPHR